MDKKTAMQLVDFIFESISIIKKRFSIIKKSDDFLENDEGLEKLDSISMRLQTIGEAVKNLEKREKELLKKVAEDRYWSEIIKTRDFISRHYVDLDSEVVFDICENELAELEEKILKLKDMLNSVNDKDI